MNVDNKRLTLNVFCKMRLSRLLQHTNHILPLKQHPSLETERS